MSLRNAVAVQIYSYVVSAFQAYKKNVINKGIKESTWRGRKTAFGTAVA